MHTRTRVCVCLNYHQIKSDENGCSKLIFFSNSKLITTTDQHFAWQSNEHNFIYAAIITEYTHTYLSCMSYPRYVYILQFTCQFTCLHMPANASKLDINISSLQCWLLSISMRFCYLIQIVAKHCCWSVTKATIIHSACWLVCEVYYVTIINIIIITATTVNRRIVQLVSVWFRWYGFVGCAND